MKAAIRNFVFAIVFSTSATALAKAPCEQPAKVCDAREAVFQISAFDPVGSAVRVGPDLLVTSRHIVADRQKVELLLKDGRKVFTAVEPADYAGDIILLRTDALPEGPVLKIGSVTPGETVHTVGADLSRKRIRAYKPGKVRFVPLGDKPLSRLHHSAYTRRGNSGGAVVNSNGELLGIAASGGEGRFEAVPASAIADLKAMSGKQHADPSQEIGGAVRICTLNLERLYGKRGVLEEQDATALGTSCRRTGNRQYYDLAGQILSQRGRFQSALPLFEASVAQDPNAVNSRLNLIITFHIARLYEKELPHLKWLMEHAANNMQVLRLSIQAGTWTGEKELVNAAFAKLKKINPNAAAAAERFLKSPPPRPKPL